MPWIQETLIWRDDELIGESLGLILPPSFRDSHHAGFARFQLTEVSKVLNHPLKLATYCSDGRAIDSEHFIVAEKKRGWELVIRGHIASTHLHNLIRPPM